jgi:hypothetical protein
MTKKTYLIVYKERIDAKSEKEVEEYIQKVLLPELSSHDLEVVEEKPQADTPSVGE